jgi:hypothetical protein
VDRPICIQAVGAAIIGPVPFGLVQDHTPFVQRMSGARSGNRMLDSDQSNQERWVTYAQAGELLGISTQAARMLAKRRGWARRTPNAYGDRALILLPDDVSVQPCVALSTERAGHTTPSDSDQSMAPDRVNVQPFVDAIEALREQLGITHRQVDEANARADRAELRADDERRRADEERTRAEQQIETLRKKLSELRIAERLATAELADLRGHLDQTDAERRQTLDRLTAAQEQIAALLTDQRTSPPVPARRSWLPWRRCR